MVKIVDFDGNAVGNITVGSSRVSGDNELTKDMADTYMFRVDNYSQAEAREYWEFWTNGYLAAEVPETD